MKKLNILHIHDYPPFEGGGIEIMVSTLSEEFVKLGHKVTVATSRFKSETFNINNGVEVRNGVKAVLIKTSDQLCDLIKDADIVNVHFTFSCRAASMSALEVCIRKGKPCICSIHTNIEHIPFSALSKMNEFEINTKLQDVKRLFSNDNIFLTAPSNNVNHSLAKIGVKKELVIIRNSTKIHEISSNDIKPVDITYLGEVSFMKGVNYLIDSIYMVKKTIPNISVRIIGGGSDFDHMQLMTKFFNLQNNIIFTGYVTHAEVGNYLSNTKLYVHPSLTETWANAVSEALSLSVPVICTDVGGLGELINNGKFANKVIPADSYDLASKIISVLSSRKNYISIKKKADLASRYVIKNYSLEKQTQEYISLYYKVYEQKYIDIHTAS